MPLTEFFAFSAFAWIGSFTPGPNVAIAATTGVNHGLRAALPQVAGVPLGFVVMMWVIGSSSTLVLQQYPVLILMMKILGNAYLLYLAWKLCFSTSLADNRGMQALTLPQAALFQVVNPKAWMMLVAATSTYAIGQGDFLNRMTWMRQQLRAWLLVGQRLRYFNRSMGAALACTALWMVM